MAAAITGKSGAVTANPIAEVTRSIPLFTNRTFQSIAPKFYPNFVYDTPYVIRVKLPGLLEYRDLAIRMVASACKLVPSQEDRENAFDAEVISAFGEAFNNVALHSYASSGGDLEIEIETSADGIVIRLKDFGKSYDFEQVPVPDLDALPESGLGIYIMRSCMDDVTYSSGPPNVLTMSKKRGGNGGGRDEDEHHPD